ncbi:MAG: flavin-containing monooxygenase [Actinomycetes bacterium]
MRTVDTVIVGAGHAGLAVSQLLSAAQRDHVVLERGRVANSWRTQRWDSLRLLTPAWLSRLPGYRPIGRDGFPAAAEVVDHLASYAAWSGAPVHEHTTVLSVRRCGSRWRVVTDAGSWDAAHVVVASGHTTLPTRPDTAAHLPASVQQLHPLAYRNPAQVDGDRVLVVGASASGAQIADELAAAGHEVTLAVGGHTRLPRRYRARDILWWMERAGVLDRTVDDVTDLEAARRAPSMQLVGRDDGRSVDLAALSARGIRLTGRVRGVDDDGTVRLADNLADSVATADARMHRLLDGLDDDAARRAGRRDLGRAARPVQVPLPARRPTELDLGRERISTVVWATGFRGDYSYLHVPRLVRDGRIPQRRGATDAPGLFVIGQRFAHRRRSSFIDGARFDAADIVAAITRTRAITDATPRWPAPGAGSEELPWTA